jgi:membrane-associated phospholipid phosphatase
MNYYIRSLVSTVVRNKRVMYAFLVFSVCIAFFASLADEVAENETLPYDQAVLQAIRSVATPTLDTVFVIGTDFGGFIGASVLGLLVAAYLVYKRQWRKTIFLAFALIGAALLNVLLKLIFIRDRPDLWEHLVVESSYSFPSGHAMGSSALAMAVTILGWKTHFRWLILGVAAIYMIFIGFSRLYLGVHYPTDIVAGWLISAAWVSVVYYFMRRPQVR